MMQSCRYYTARNWWDGDKDTSKAKALRPTIIYYLQALKLFYLWRLGATSFTQKKRKRPPSKDESARQGP